jgi:adenine-specific DNA-methyltransferase
MPVLNWIGKEKIVNHDKELPYRVLKPRKDLSVGENSENLLIQGDNLEALKSLLPQYQGKVKCIYIDPPYNTGNEGWVYNDKVNSPQIKQWLNKVVGAEGEDLCRHDKWLCMMYPRLKLLHNLLKDDGIIFISIDDNEVHNLRVLMNDIFGEANFLTTIAWEKRFTRSNNAKLFASSKEYLLVYRKSPALTNLKEVRTEKANSIYSNPDNDPRGDWTSVSYVNPASKSQRPNLVYKVKNPFTGEEIVHPTNAWKFEYNQHLKHVEENKLLWGKNGGNRYPRLKKFLSEVSAGIVPTDIWSHEESGTTDEGTKDLQKILGDRKFDNPKPVRLIKRIISMATAGSTGDIILDSFSGSGTTGQAVLELNREDDANRKFILIELEQHIAESITSKRLGKVMSGYDGALYPEGTGQGFQYLDLNGELFDSNGMINRDAHYEDLAGYIYFSETGKHVSLESVKSPWIGEAGGVNYFLLFSKPDKNILDEDWLKNHATGEGQKVVYADKSLVDEEVCARYGVVFKQIPYELRQF